MKQLLLGLACMVPLHLFAADQDSVYSWGAWSQGIKPAAGPVVNITPAPVDQPQVDFRPNENAAFRRSIQLPSLPEVTPDSLQLPVIQVPIDNATSDPRSGRSRS